MQVSIIIPVLNEGEQAIACLRRLAPLREAGHELILVDGGSERPAFDTLQPWADQLLESDTGRAKQMNLGARAARGEDRFGYRAEFLSLLRLAETARAMGNR